MDERYRVPDRRYRRGYRLTPRAHRARRKWWLLITLFVVLALAQVPVSLLTLYLVGLVAYAIYKSHQNRQELRELAAERAEVPAPPLHLVTTEPGPLGETRQRVPASPEIRSAVWIRDGGACRHCGITDADSMARDGIHLEMDHVIPFSQNGADTVNNFQLLCKRCNTSKGNRYSG